ncbi:hypothetical protein D3C71_1656140 [compost metagenome]
MGVAHEEMLHKILILGIHTDNAAASALLAAVGADRQTLDVTSMCNRNDNLFTRNQILVENAFFSNRDFSTAVIRILIPNLLQLIADDLQHEMLISQNLAVLRNFSQ